MAKTDAALWFSLPAGADPQRDIPVGQDELGNPLYRTRAGTTYVIKQQASPEQKGEPGAWERARSVLGARARGAVAGVIDAVTAPGRAARGEAVRNGEVLAAAGLGQIGGAAGFSRASRSSSLYTRPTESEVGNVLGRTGSGGVDLEGRPLVARHVVGRTPDRAREQSLPAEALAEIVEATGSGSIKRTPARGLRGGAVGQTRFDRSTGKPIAVEVRDGLTPSQFEAVARHEVGHLIDEIAGQIDTKGLGAELRPLYHYGIEGRERANRHTLPEHLNYSAAEASREYMAEAIRQYMSAPDAMKQMAPKTAARIRAAVNEHEKLKHLIQFNANASPAVGLISTQIEEGAMNGSQSPAEVEASDYDAIRNEMWTARRVGDEEGARFLAGLARQALAARQRAAQGAGGTRVADAAPADNAIAAGWGDAPATADMAEAVPAVSDAAVPPADDAGFGDEPPTYDMIMKELRTAHRVGDTEGARLLARMAREARDGQMAAASPAAPAGGAAPGETAPLSYDAIMKDLRAAHQAGDVERARQLAQMARESKGMPVTPVERPRSQVLMDEYERAEAAGDHVRADELLREASYAATQDGTAPDSVAYNPGTGGMEDMALRGDRGRWNAAAQGLGQGLSFGGMDEAVGLMHGVTGPGTYEQNRDYALASMRGDLASGRRDYPVTAYGAEIAGGAASSIAAASAAGLTGRASLGAQARQGAAIGATEGAAYGGLSAEGGAGERAAGAARGALFGGAVGAAAPYAVAGVRRGYDYAIGGPVASMRSAPDQVRASRAVQTAVDRSGRSVDEIDDAIRAAHAAGQTGYGVADATGYSGQRMLAGAARTPGEGRQGIVDHLARRQDGQGRRIAVALDDALNAPRNPRNLPAAPGQMPGDNRGATAKSVRERLTSARNRAANTAYDAARRDAGPVDVRGALGVIDDRIGPMQGSGITGDGIDAKLSRYRSRLAAQPGGEAFPGAASVELSDFNRVLGVKQDIADDIGAAVRAGRNNEARVLSQLRDALDQSLEGASGAYRSANDDFARASRVIDQIDAGAAATRPNSRVADTLGHYASQTPEGQAAFRAGYADPLMGRIENAAPGVNKARPLMSDGASDELRAFARNPDELSDFLRREDQMFRTANAASGGSMTADNLADAADVASAGASAVRNLLTGNWSGAARQISDNVVNTLMGRNTATREEIARLLLSGDIRGALAPAIERELQNAMRSAFGEAGIRSLERTTNPQ